MERLLKKFETAKDAGAAAGAAQGRAARRASARIYFGSTSPAMSEALDALAGARRARRHAARARVPVRATRSTAFIAAHDDVFVVEQNRDAQLRTLLVNEHSASTRPSSSRCCTTTARRSRRASSSRRSPTHVRADNVEPITQEEGQARMTYLAKPKLHHPDPADATSSASRGATTKARSRRCAPAAATTRSRPRSSRPAGSSTSSRTASPSSRASAAARRRPTISSAPRTASTPCTAACRRC